MNAVRLPVRQGTPEWLEARRGLVSSTDLPIILGLNPWRCEAELADEKRGLVESKPASAAMRLGSAMESFVADEYVGATGKRLRRVTQLIRHPEIEWAVASLDREVVGERRMVEIKTTSARWDDEIPQAIQAQVQWALGVGGYPVADVAAWFFGAREPFQVFEVEADKSLFDALVVIAEDFRRRLAEGGPFAEDAASIKARYPTDNGTELEADAELSEAVRSLVDLRGRRKGLEDAEEVVETAIKARMAEATALVGDGFRVTWKRTKDQSATDWKSVADGLLRQLPETERAALVGLATTVRPGFRPFRVVMKGEPE